MILYSIGSWMWDIFASIRKIIIKKRDTNNINTARKIATLNLFQTSMVQSDPLAQLVNFEQLKKIIQDR